MPKMTDFADVHKYFAAMYRRYQAMGAERSYTLERMQSLMGYLGNPQETLRVIHVAGTSGKGSTAYYVSALLEQANAKVGLTVSPHIMEVNERVQINRTPLSESELCASLSVFVELVEKSGTDPTYFELLTAFAYWYFAKSGVDYAVIEVGLGGLLDATNVVRRSDKVCVICDIGFDHTAVLGSTLEAIAGQKAGIVQGSNQVFVHRQVDEIMSPIRARCDAEQATLHELDSQKIEGYEGLVRFQRRNFVLAAAAARYVLTRDGLPTLQNDQVQRASRISIPGRMEVVAVAGKTLILDGAHNAQKMAALLDGINERYPSRPVALLLAVVQSSDDRWERMCDELAGRGLPVVTTEFLLNRDMPKRSVPAADVAKYLREHGASTYEVHRRLERALAALLHRPEPVLVITGSLYLLGEVRRRLSA